MRIEQVDQLPESLDALRQESEREGFVFVSRLVRDFAAGVNCFDKPGEALFVVYSGANIVAVGGVNHSHVTPAGTVGRVRRVFVSHRVRGQGVGEQLMRRIERWSKSYFCELELFTDTTAASKFYETLGYQTSQSSAQVPADSGLRVSHRKTLSQPTIEDRNT